MPKVGLFGFSPLSLFNQQRTRTERKSKQRQKLKQATKDEHESTTNNDEQRLHITNENDQNDPRAKK